MEIMTHPCTECICGLAAAVTDLLQSVELEYNGYQGDTKGADGTDNAISNNKGATDKQVKEHLNGLFSLVQGLGGTAVVRTYIDQLAQVLSALVGWSEIEKCWDNDKCKKGDKVHHGTRDGCEYLKDMEAKNKCGDCGCMKYVVIPRVDWVQLGRGCQRCKDSGTEEEKKQQECKCGDSCTAATCKCAKEGRCCKCCCTGCSGCKKECSCIEEDKDKVNDAYNRGHRIYNDSYQSAYSETVLKSFTGESHTVIRQPKWNDLIYLPDSDTTSQRRHRCARILLGSVCLIWSGITYMHWTGKWAKGSPYWNNHILDGSGLDDGTLSQWLQALGFPRDMLNDKGPKNRLDQVIWDGFRDMLFLGFLEPSGLGHDVSDTNGNTARAPFGMNYAGFVHTAHRDSFNTDQATVFPNGTSSSSAVQISESNQHKNGAIFKLYILSCAYFTGLQQKAPPKAENRTPKTIREILYWLSALPYSQAYPEILEHSKEVLKKVAPEKDGTKTLSFLQTGRTAPITVHEFNLFAHFQAVTQYCPLLLIGIQGGLKGSDTTKEPPIHSLYANTECSFTYPTVSIQAYNQVVHYIRALFYQLYFLRKQCAVKVAMGGKWRECRYGKDVVSKGVISWMCLGCDPMEHDRKCRVDKVKEELGKVVSKGKDTVAVKVKALLEAIGQVVVQLGNAQEALEGKKKEAIEGVKGKLTEAREGLETAVNGNGGMDGKLGEAKNKLGELTNGGSGILKDVEDALGTAQNDVTNVDPGKNKISAAIKGVRNVLDELRKGVEGLKQEKENEIMCGLSEVFGVPVEDNELEKALQQEVSHEYTALLQAINKLKDICNTAKCSACDQHSNKCGKPSQPGICEKCLQPTTTGVPSPLQAFLEDRLPGFSCDVVRSDDNDTPNYPLASSHLGHCNGSGQCCPLPMGFRGQFQKGVTNTGQRLYGILYFFSNENMMQSCVYTLVRVTSALSATTPQVLGDVFGFFRGGVGNKESGKTKNGSDQPCKHDGNPSTKPNDYFCGWCASGLRDVVNDIEWVPSDSNPGGHYMSTVGKALRDIKGGKDSVTPLKSTATTTTTTNTSLSRLTENCQYLSPLTGELYTAVSATFGGTYLSWVLYLSDALHSGLESLSEAFLQIECRGCKGQCDPNKCKKGEHGQKSDGQVSGLCQCQSIVSCTGVLPVLYRHGFSYGNPFNLEGYQQEGEKNGDYSIEKKDPRLCHQFLDSLSAVINKKKESEQKDQDKHPLTNLLSQVGQLQYDIRLPWIFVLTLAWLVAVLYLAFGAIWPLDWAHMRSHWLRGGEHQWQCMWYKVMTGRKGMELVEYFGQRLLVILVMV
eukprot:XP_001608795.1 variant erythrocyte surface antigen-1, alpha subunit [Babesia bovis T2Bo]